MPVAVDTRMENLRRANHVRVYRSEVKRNLAAGAPVCPMVADPPAELLTMRLFDLLRSLPKFGPSKTRGFMRSLGLSPDKTVAGLSERQRGVLVAALREAGLC